VEYVAIYAMVGIIRSEVIFLTRTVSARETATPLALGESAGGRGIGVPGKLAEVDPVKIPEGFMLS